MFEDEIIKETRRRRDEYAAQFDYDLNAILADLQKKQTESNRQYVSFTARNPRSSEEVTKETKAA